MKCYKLLSRQGFGHTQDTTPTPVSVLLADKDTSNLRAIRLDDIDHVITIVFVRIHERKLESLEHRTVAEDMSELRMKVSCGVFWQLQDCQALQGLVAFEKETFVPVKVSVRHIGVGNRSKVNEFALPLERDNRRRQGEKDLGDIIKRWMGADGALQLQMLEVLEPGDCPSQDADRKRGGNVNSMNTKIGQTRVETNKPADCEDQRRGAVHVDGKAEVSPTIQGLEVDMQSVQVCEEREGLDRLHMGPVVWVRVPDRFGQPQRDREFSRPCVTVVVVSLQLFHVFLRGNIQEAEEDVGYLERADTVKFVDEGGKGVGGLYESNDLLFGNEFEMVPEAGVEEGMECTVGLHEVRDVVCTEEGREQADQLRQLEEGNRRRRR